MTCISQKVDRTNLYMFVCGVQRIFRVTGGRRGCLDIYSCLV